MIDNILISLSFVFLVRNINSNEINDLTFKSDRLLEASHRTPPPFPEQPSRLLRRKSASG